MAAPWGEARGVMALRGIPLPPRGSFKDEILAKLIQRERAELFSRTRMEMRILGDGLGVPSERVEAMLELYMLELSQDRYRPHVAQALRAFRHARRAQVDRDSELLAKVDKLDDGALMPWERRRHDGATRRRR